MNFVKLIASAAVVCAGLMTTTATASTVTIENGSFELPGTFTRSFLTLASGSTAIDGWTVGGAGVDLIHTYWQASDNNFSLDMNAYDAGSISQTIDDLRLGSVYKISFDLAGNPDRGPATKVLMASIGNYSGTFDFDITGKTRTNMGWDERSFEFTATSTSMLLSFSGSSSGAWGPALDNVSIEKISDVPVPASLLLFGTSLGALGIMRSRRRKKRA